MECKKLTSLNIPDSVHTLENFGLHNLQYLKLPKNLQNNNPKDYFNCFKIDANEVTIPINIFYQCNIADMIEYNHITEVINVIYDNKISMVNVLQITGTICSKFKPEKCPTINFIHSSDWKPKR